jgi:hypothetical protein
VDLLAAHAVVEAVRLGDIAPAPREWGDRRGRRRYEKQPGDRDGSGEEGAHCHSLTDVRDNDPMADEVDRLYELPLEEFTGARNELAKQLGDASVKQLKKPSVPAWAVNQLARRREVDLRRLLRAGEQLEQAQRDAVSGGDQQAFETARGAERDAVRKLRSEAADLLKAGGHPAADATLERVTKTLHAGSATEEGRTLLREGRLTEELEPQGFDALAGVKPSAPRARQGKPKVQAPDRRRARKAREEAEAARREADAAAAGVRDAERELDRLRRNAERAATKAEQLESKAAQLEK